MRLHTMTVTAFGPFAGTETINFDALFDAGVFLLKGATGAGKTSVLDAVCFALYGSVPGRRPTSRLRSDHASGHLRARVELEFSVAGRRFKITRTPGQTYTSPRAKGGSTTAAPTAQLHGAAQREDGTTAWEPITAHVQETGSQITTLLGLTKDQFCQVVLLPQGDFAAFLHASAVDRRDLLSHLFNTHRFQDLQNWLTNHRNTLKGHLQEARTAVDRLGERIEQAAGPRLLASAPPPQESRDTTLTPWTCELLTLAVAARDTATAAQTQTDHAHEHAKEAHGQATDLASRQQRHHDALTRRAELDQHAEHNQHLRTRLEQARSAEHLRPLLEAADTAAERLAEAKETEHSARQLLDATHQNATIAELEHAQHDLHAVLGRLEGLQPREERREELGRRVAELEDKEKLLQEELNETEEWLRDWPQIHTAATAHITILRSTAEQLPHLAKEEAALTRQLEAAQLRDDLAVTLQEASVHADQHDTEARTAHERWLAVREQRLDGMAAELAGALEDGRPCAVCGSLEHPRPAPPSDHQPTAADEDEAALAHQRAKKAHEAANQARNDLAARHAQALGAAGPEPLTEIRTRLEQAHTVHEDALARAAELVEAEQDLAEQQAEHDRRENADTRTRQQLTECQTSARALLQEQQQIAREIDEARGDAPTLEQRITEHTTAKEHLAGVVTQARRVTVAEARYTDAAAAVRKSATTAGFPTPEQAAQALQPAEITHQWQKELEGWDRNDATITGLLATPELVEAGQLPAVDLAAAQAALAEAENAVRSAATEAHEARTRVADLQALTGELTEKTRRLRPLQDDFAVADRLADIAGGRSSANTLGMELEAYVLACRLKEIASAANTRLRTMTDRFELVYSQDKEPGRGRTKAGLSLRILDTWTGVERETSTLSGGETFTTSLALALGLADVVTAEGGGRPLGVLFVDEGFGSLDEQSLAEVMDILDQLRSGDRAVGVVSHVGELSGRIPTQLHVHKERNGSTLRAVSADV